MKFLLSFRPLRIPLAAAMVLSAALPIAATAEPVEEHDELSQLDELFAQVAREPVPTELPKKPVDDYTRPLLTVEKLAKLVEKEAISRLVRQKSRKTQVDAAWPKLVATLDSELYPVSRAASRVMGVFPSRLVPMVPALIKDRGAGTVHLKSFGLLAWHTKARLLNEAVPYGELNALQPYLDSPEENQRLYVAWAVVQTYGWTKYKPETTDSIIQKLTSLLQDPSGAVRAQAARSLGKLGKRGRLGTEAASVEAALALLAQEPDQPGSPLLDSFDAKWPSIPPKQVLPDSGGVSLPFPPRATQWSEPPPEKVYYHIWKGPEAPILQGEGSPDHMLTLREPARQGALALGSIGSVKPLIELMSHQSPEIRFNGIEALRMIEGDRPGTEPVLLTLAKDPDPLVRQAAFVALGERPPSADALGIVLEGTRDQENFHGALAAIKTLGRMGWKDDSGRVSAACKSRLIPLLIHENESLVVTAVVALRNALPEEDFATIVKASLFGEPAPVHSDRLLLNLLYQLEGDDGLDEEALAAGISLIISAMEADLKNLGNIREETLLDLKRWIRQDAEKAESWPQQAPRLLPTLRRALAAEELSASLMEFIRRLGPHAAPLRPDLEALLKENDRELHWWIKRTLSALEDKQE